MDIKTRIEKIKEITEGVPFGRQEIMWGDHLESMPVYKIPLEYLVYNKYNGRILTRTKSLEKQGIIINPETEEGKKLIGDLLWSSKEESNRATKSDIEKYGQQKIGVITQDGVIVDGNRRAMILNKIGNIRNFKAIVLPTTSDKNIIEIEKLETSYQMGEDAKLGYNPTEKYLKVKVLKAKGVKEAEIADWMNESSKNIEGYISVMKLMDDYLDYLGYNGIYTQLDNREGQFVDLNQWLNNFYGEQSSKAFDGYTDEDVDDLKDISFDYIRAKFEGKNFRYLAQGQKGSHLFGDKAIWEEFKERHFNFIQQIIDDEDDFNLDSSNLQLTLNGRDRSYSDKVSTFLEDNLDEFKQELKRKKHINQPEILVKEALRAVDVASQNKHITSTGVLEKFEELFEKTGRILTRRSPNITFKQILQMFESIELTGFESDKDEMTEVLVKIQHKLNSIKDNVKKL